MNLKVRTFANDLDVSETNIRNYTTRDSKPSSDIIERILRQYPQVNALWLITGDGEPFLEKLDSNTSSTITAHKNKGNIQSNAGSNNTITNNVKLEDCQRDLATAKSESELLREQLASKDALLAAKDVVIAAKDETITLLRATYNRPN